MLRQLISHPKNIFGFIRPSMCISKQIKWILKKAIVIKKCLHIFAIHSSSRHEKRCTSCSCGYIPDIRFKAYMAKLYTPTPQIGIGLMQVLGTYIQFMRVQSLNYKREGIFFPGRPNSKSINLRCNDLSLSFQMM